VVSLGALRGCAWALVGALIVGLSGRVGWGGALGSCVWPYEIKHSPKIYTHARACSEVSRGLRGWSRGVLTGWPRRDGYRGHPGSIP